MTARCSCSRATRLARALSSRPAAVRRSRRAGVAPGPAGGPAAAPAGGPSAPVGGPAVPAGGPSAPTGGPAGSPVLRTANSAASPALPGPSGSLSGPTAGPMTGPLAGASTNPAGPAIPAGLIGPTCPIDPAAISVNSAAASRRKAPRAAPVAAGRPGPSPLQKGRRELRPGAGSTTTRSAPISRTRQLVVPRVMMSPTAVSLTISSSSSPTRRRPEPVSPSGRTTGKAPRSGMVPEAVTAER